jgi:hypothetical protein
MNYVINESCGYNILAPKNIKYCLKYAKETLICFSHISNKFQNIYHSCNLWLVS